MYPSTKVFFEYINSYVLGAKSRDVVHRFLKHTTCQPRHECCHRSLSWGLEGKAKKYEVQAKGEKIGLANSPIGWKPIHSLLVFRHS
jgi:hypothetical protein